MTKRALSPIGFAILGLAVAAAAGCGGAPAASTPAGPADGAAPGADATGEENELGNPGAPATTPHQMGTDPGRTPEMGE